MKNLAYKPRLIYPQIDDYLTVMGAVVIEGLKWYGVYVLPITMLKP